MSVETDGEADVSTDEKHFCEVPGCGAYFDDKNTVKDHIVRNHSFDDRLGALVSTGPDPRADDPDAEDAPADDD